MQPANLKLAVVTPGLEIGGAETQIALLAPLLAERGWDVSVLSMLKAAAAARRLTEAGVGVVHLGLKERGLCLSTMAPLARTAARLSKELGRLNPDVVHSHMTPANIMTRLLRPWRGMPVLVCTAHSIVEPPEWRNLMYRVSDRFCDLTTNICRVGVEQSISDGRVPSGRVVHMPNGVDTANFKFDPQARSRLRDELGVGDRFVWLAVGRLTWEKDWPSMIRAFKATPGDSLLLAAGGGELFGDLLSMVAAAGLEKRVRFLGEMPAVQHLMCAADGFVMSSKIEGSPMVLLEASSCGLPIVATRVGGIPEIVKHGATGFLVIPGSPGELSSAMRNVEALPEDRRKEMGRRGCDRVREQFDIQIIVNRWDSLYRQLLAKNAPECAVARNGQGC